LLQVLTINQSSLWIPKVDIFLIPFFLFKVVEKIKLDREVSMYLNIANSLLFSILIVIFAFCISNKINITGEVFAKIIRNA